MMITPTALAEPTAEGADEVVCITGEVSACVDHVGVNAGGRGFCLYLSGPALNTEPCST